MICLFCDEPVALEDAVETPVVGKAGLHYEHVHVVCQRRQMIGSIGHQLRLCTCYVKDGPTLGDPAWLTKRQAAVIAVAIADALVQSGALWSDGGLTS